MIVRVLALAALVPVPALAARGQSLPSPKRAEPARLLRCSSVKYAEYSPSSRLAAGPAAPISARSDFVHGLLANGAGTGSMKGTVRASQAPRDLPAVKIAKDASVCGKEAARDALVIAADGALANVVVAVRGLKPKQAPAPVTGAAVDQVGCRYAPHVQAVTVGTALNVLNNDAVLHNVHGTLDTTGSPVTVFNIAMPFKGGKSPQILRRPGPMKLRCDAGHTWMSAYVHVFDHPYYAVTDSQGRFTIKDLPPGKHTVELWHEPIADKQKPIVQTMTVEVAAGQTTVADAAMSF